MQTVTAGAGRIRRRGSLVVTCSSAALTAARILASQPCDAVLSDGVGRRSSLDDRPLLRTGRAAGQALAGVAARCPEVRSGLAGANGSLT